MSYKAFISYSHAADGQLAPALQNGLHRIAKPFYRLRAMRIFRDETNLHLTPKLWPLIQQALSESEHFVLMASPRAVESEWVKNEVDEWLRTRGAALDKFHLVLTEGEVVWDESTGDFDWEKTTALPTNLRGKFETEPLFLDLRWARETEHLSLRNPQFLRAVGKLAAALRNEPLDAIIGEDVRQHRVFKFAAGVAIVLLSVLLIVASAAAFYANKRRNDALESANREKLAKEEETRQREQAEIATKNEGIARGVADERRLEAEKQTGIAKEQRKEAEKQTGIANEERKEAEKQTAIANEQREEAEKQTGVAQEQRRRAEEQTAIAEERQREAVKQRSAAEAARDEASFQLAESLADRAEEQAAPGKDIVQAFHLAHRAAMVSPKGRPETSFHIARALHIAASLPRVKDLDTNGDQIISAALDPDLKHVLAVTGNYKINVWEISSGNRKPLPAELEAIVGKPDDVVTGDGGEEFKFLEFSSDGRLAKTVFADESLWIWEVETGKKRAQIKVDYTLDRIEFSKDGQSIIGTQYLYSGNYSTSTGYSAGCHRKVLWQAENAPSPAEELAKQCSEKERDEDSNKKELLYRGLRPILVQGDDRRYDGQYLEKEGQNWVTFGMSRNEITLAAVARNGQLNFWDYEAEPLVRKWNLQQNSMAARIVGDGSSLLILTRDGQVVQQKFDGSRVWSAAVSKRADGVEFEAGEIWNTSSPGTFLVTYKKARKNQSDYPRWWLELWKVGEFRPRQHIEFTENSISDLILAPDESGGITEVWGEEEYNYLEQWSFKKDVPSSPRLATPVNNVIKGVFLGITRDGKVLLEGDDRELRFLHPISRDHIFDPFVFSEERSISGKAVAAILKQAHDLRSTNTGIAATLPNGKTAELFRDKIGSRFEVDQKLVRGTVTESDHVLSPDGKLICGIHRYRSAPGRAGSMYDLVVREVETGRIIAGHFRVPYLRIVGFTPGNKTILMQEFDGTLLELFVHGGNDQVPAWYEDLGSALTGVRLLPNLGLSSPSADELKATREKVRYQLDQVNPDSDEMVRFVLSRLLGLSENR